MKILIINNNQYGYHLDTYYYCQYAARQHDVTYLCFDFDKPKQAADNVNVVYVSRTGGYIRRAFRFYMASFRLYKIFRPNFSFIKYFKIYLITLIIIR